MTLLSPQVEQIEEDATIQAGDELAKSGNKRAASLFLALLEKDAALTMQAVYWKHVDLELKNRIRTTGWIVGESMSEEVSRWHERFGNTFCHGDVATLTARFLTLQEKAFKPVKIPAILRENASPRQFGDLILEVATLYGQEHREALDAPRRRDADRIKRISDALAQLGSMPLTTDEICKHMNRAVSRRVEGMDKRKVMALLRIF
ncbi:hypothetical protein [Catalinimonas alkaloidigena]|uniref:hypothetical protein n=1 Tax=Catalinimonas alkaloidigena TaxID=1075417 RepID=UPI00115F9D05|nr:hypothetical protein [Catalinimonas alkaloidigena]